LVCDIQKLEVLDNKKHVVFHSSAEINFLPDHPIHVKFHNKGLMFKLEPGHFMCAGNLINFPLPEVAKALELRSSPRIKIPQDQEVRLSIMPVTTKASMGLEVRLLDFSTTGIAISCSHKNSDLFYHHSHFEIESINGNPLIPPLTAVVAQLSITKNKKDNIRVGFKFDGELSLESLNEFMLNAFVDF
jgi:c-di-GMP-binding flagellar brake protein YcgR